MDSEALTRIVVEEVLRRLGGGVQVTPPRRLALVEAGPRLAVILAGLVGEPDLAVVLVGRAAKAPEATAFAAGLLRILPDDIDAIERDVLPGVETLLLPSLRPGTLARIATGLDHGTIPCLTQAALWAGKQVVASPAMPEGGTPAYRRLFEGYVERLKEFGVTIGAATAPPTPTAAPSAPAPETSAPTETRFEGRLLTAPDVLSLLKSGVRELIVPRGAIVTAMAADTARERGLRLTRR